MFAMISKLASIKMLGAAAVAGVIGMSAAPAQARTHISFGIGFGGYAGPSYCASPIYYRPAPVYYAPAPVVYTPAPVYYTQPVYSTQVSYYEGNTPYYTNYNQPQVVASSPVVYQPVYYAAPVYTYSPSYYYRPYSYTSFSFGFGGGYGHRR